MKDKYNGNIYIFFFIQILIYSSTAEAEMITLILQHKFTNFVKLN